MFCRVMIQGKMVGSLLSLLVDEDNHRVSQKAASPIPGLVAGAGLEQMVVTVLETVQVVLLEEKLEEALVDPERESHDLVLES